MHAPSRNRARLPAPRLQPRCPYCQRAKPDQKTVKRHIFATKACYESWKKDVQSQSSTTTQSDIPAAATQANAPGPTASEDSDVEMQNGDEVDFHPADYFEPAPIPEPVRDQRARVEEVDEDDEDHPSCGPRYVETYPRPVGTPLRREKTAFEVLKERLEADKREPWEPFANEEEWELASWLMKSVGQTSTDDFLKLPIIQNRNDLSFHNSYSFLKKVDQLPTGPGWQCEMVEVVGDKLAEDGKPMKEELELWKRDPVECIKELMGNPAFKDLLSYTPERVYVDEEGTNRSYDEMWTGDWWWRMQAGHRLPGCCR